MFGTSKVDHGVSRGRGRAVKVAVIGHTGMGGAALTEVAALTRARGHGRRHHADKAEAQLGLTSLTVDVWDGPALRDALRGHDVVVSAFSGGHEMDPIVYYRQAEGTRRIIKAFRESGAGYLVYIGGAASLFVKPGVQMFDDERFPRWYFGTHPATHLRWLGDITGVPLFYEAAERRENGTIGPYDSDPEIEDAVKDWSRVWLLEGCRIALDLFEGRSDFRWSSSRRRGGIAPAPAAARTRPAWTS